MISKTAPREIQDHYIEIEKHSNNNRLESITVLDEYAAICINGYHEKYFCGYTWFKTSEIPEDWLEYDNIDYNLDIHGGLTYSTIVGDYVIYGFDCAHLDDENNPNLRDETYVLELCRVMRSEILKAISERNKII